MPLAKLRVLLAVRPGWLTHWAVFPSEDVAELAGGTDRLAGRRNHCCAQARAPCNQRRQFRSRLHAGQLTP
jgi:hypothetical protein